MASNTYDHFKRILDISASLVALTLTAPVQLGVAIAVLLRLGRPVLFRQPRPGRNEEIFTLIKFRSMIEPNENRGLVSDADRLTPFGAFLRSTSLDELPSLWNVLVGDMSFVGPRPLLPEYLELYTAKQRTRHAVRPGITGLAQVAGRNRVSWEQRFDLDVDYVQRRSLTLDARILLRTLRLVVAREGITSENDATAAPFQGSGTSTLAT